VSADRPSFSVIAPTYNRCDVVARTLDHLEAQDYPPELIEVLICDNSTDGTAAMVAERAASSPISLRLLRSDERLPAVKRNQGLLAAAGDLVLFINDDVWFRSDALTEHARTHLEHGRPIAVLGHVEQSTQMPRTPFIDWYRPFAYDRIVDRAGRSVPYHFSWSMNLSLPRQVMLDRQLVFHEDWANIGHEDVELGYRWTGAGYEIIYNPRAWGEHFHPHTLDSACRLQESVGRGLRDLEVLIPEADLLERYGVFRWTNAPRSVIRGVLRKALFNPLTVPPLQRRLGRLDRTHRLAEWSYWKVMLHHTERGYHLQPARNPRPVPTLPRLVSERVA
jgi:GT2 family glycosyltransferase